MAVEMRPLASMVPTKPMMRTPAMINVRTATELFGFPMINEFDPCTAGRPLLVTCCPAGAAPETDAYRPAYERPAMYRTFLLPITFLSAWGLCAQPDQAATRSADELFHAGERAYKGGDQATAIQLYSEALALDPEHLNAYLQRGFCHSLQRAYAAAVSDFTAVIDRQADHLWAYTSRGSAYGKLGKEELAIQDFNTVLRLDPRNQEAYNNRGWAKKAAGDAEGACADWNASRKMGNAEARIILKNNRCK